MQIYFSKLKEDDIFTLSKEDSYHIIRVMRMNKQDKVEVVDNQKEYICEIISLDENVKCKILEEIKEKEKKIPHVIIVQSLVKEQKMDYILQKSTELGVDEIIPLNAERSIIKIDNKENKKIERWNKVLKEASEQSKRNTIPILDKIYSLKDLKDIDIKHKYICSVKEKEKTIKSILSKISISDTILFVIGPEGGLSDKEEEMLVESGFERITLGSNVLRTETASSFILSAIDYEFMR